MQETRAEIARDPSPLRPYGPPPPCDGGGVRKAHCSTLLHEKFICDSPTGKGRWPAGPEGDSVSQWENRRPCAPSPPPPFGHLPLRGRSSREAAALANKFTT